MVAAPVAGPQWFAGIDDALEVARESLHALPDNRRTQTVTRKHLEDALEVLSNTLSAMLGSAGIANGRRANAVVKHRSGGLSRRRRVSSSGWRSWRFTPMPPLTSRGR
jgi:hypothetical protein